MRHAVMNDENRPCILGQPTARITRARAKALGSSSRLPPKHPSGKQDEKRVLRPSLKRAAPDNDKAAGSSVGCHQPKKRAVLKDVTNINCGNLGAKSVNAAKAQKVKGEDACFAKISKVVEVRRENIVAEIHKVERDGPQDICPAVELPTEPTELSNTQLSAATSPPPPKIDSIRSIPLWSQSRDKNKLGKKQESLNDGGIIDIDSRHKDPQMCSLYAADIYSSLFAGQFDRKPSPDYMEKLQQDITQGMRGILIDWLVEVSEEYRLVPDTLYLTVNLIDRFLSENYIEKQKLQLLGVTCMLISSKYEEICAPRVEEFCFITDNTYTKEEVVQMESRILNLLRFQLSVPTAKKFLRRFIQAAQASYKVPSVELEFLANYFAELTLIDYGFLKYLPSLTAASAIFLARWTLDQSDHPWNPTLEHYTKYKASELKNAVLELQDLQLNTNGGILNAIREKYKQPKFKGVSTLRSARPVQTLFQA